MYSIKPCVFKDLAYRLAFLVIHENQFGPARNEALARDKAKHRDDNDNDNTNSSSVLKKHNIGVFAFEYDL